LLRKVLAFFCLWQVTFTAYPGFFSGGVGGEISGKDPYTHLNQVLKSRKNMEPVYGETSRLFRNARKKYPGEYMIYAEFYAGRGLWNEYAAPGVPVVSNKLVTRYIKKFQSNRRLDFVLWLRRAGKYLPLTRRILVENGLPGELACLAMVESGFDQFAFSKARAAGLWQFMPETARGYGLRVDEWVDERLDPEMSTVAASRYLLDLYRRYDSWDLAIAAYNAGDYSIKRVTRMTGCKKYWDLARKGWFSIETRYHVIKFHAAVTIMRDLDSYGFFNVELEAPLLFERVNVPPGLHLKKIADYAGISEFELVDLNPQLIRFETPPDEPVYSLKVPVGKGKMVRESLCAKPIS
jgi:membrane-bound lytic murein transglycosylase D